MCCHLARIRGFINALPEKPIVKVRTGERRLRLHQGDNRRRIDPARQKCAKRHVGEALPLDRDRQKPLQFDDRLPLIRETLRLRGNDHVEAATSTALARACCLEKHRRQK